MISPQFFIDTLKEKGLNFFAGVPDSLLKSVCAYIQDNIDKKHNIITANEGCAIGLAAGHYLSTGKIPLVYMQNSGQGNAVNPLASLTDKEVYNIPILLLIGWRGKPGVKDEPQHKKQGKITLSLLETMGIEYAILSKEESIAEQQINIALEYMNKTKQEYALIVEKDTFEPYQLEKAEDNNNFSLTREEAIQQVADSFDEKDVVVSTTGMISRELFEYRTQKGLSHERDFLTVGSMGHASSIALGIALEKTDRKIYCFDGDGALIMHMGSLAVIGSLKPNNYVHVLFNNGAHDSVGGQPTVALKADLPSVAKSLGYKTVLSVDNKEDLTTALKDIKDLQGPIFLQICVKKGNRKDLGRPTTSPIENKEVFIKFLQK